MPTPDRVPTIVDSLKAPDGRSTIAVVVPITVPTATPGDNSTTAASTAFVAAAVAAGGAFDPASPGAIGGTTPAAGTFTRVAATTAGSQHALTSTNTVSAFLTANVMSLKHTSPDGAGAIALHDASGNERGAVGYKNVGPADTYLDGAIYIAGGGYAPDGTALGVTKIIIGQEGAPGGNTARMTFATDKTITFHDTSAVVHTKVGADGGWMINPTGTGTTAKLDVVGTIICGDDTTQANRNGDGSGKGLLIDQANGQVMRLVKTSVVGMDLVIAGTSGTRRLDFVDKDNSSVIPLSVSLAGTGKVTVQKLNIANIPTSASGLSAGDVWNNSGVLTIV